MRTAARRRLRRHRDRRTSPRTRGSSRVFSKNLTATSPVTTPRPSVSACRKSWVNTRFSSGVRLRLGAAAYVVSQQVRNSKKHLRPFAPLSSPPRRATGASRELRRSRTPYDKETLPSADSVKEKQALTWILRHGASASAVRGNCLVLPETGERGERRGSELVRVVLERRWSRATEASAKEVMQCLCTASLTGTGWMQLMRQLGSRCSKLRPICR